MLNKKNFFFNFLLEKKKFNKNLKKTKKAFNSFLLDLENNEIQTIINKYKKYGNPNNLMKGNKIDIVIEKTLSDKNNSNLHTFRIMMSI